MAFHVVTWNTITERLCDDWGSIASVWGLAIGMYVLIVATGARRAAEEARLKSRRQSLTEELEEAKNKVQQIGNFLATGNLDVVRIRAEEVLIICQSVLGRWDNDPSWKKSKNKLISVSDIIRSIAEKTATTTSRPLNADEKRDTSLSQLRASELVSAVLSESRGLQEKE